MGLPVLGPDTNQQNGSGFSLYDLVVPSVWKGGPLTLTGEGRGACQEAPGSLEVLCGAQGCG